MRAFVIGMGEVGRRLADALSAAGWEVVPVTRHAGWERAAGDEDGLRLVCVREEALPEVAARLSEVPGRRLAFVQNGWVRPVLEPLGEVTRGLIWFTAKGEFFRVLRPTPFHGPAARELAAALERGGIPAEAVGGEAEFARLDADKMGFNCVVGLPLAVHGVSLGEYLDRFADEARAVFTEAVTVCSAALGVPAAPAWEAFLAAVEPIRWVSASRAKALEYRNGAVVSLAERFGLGAPVNGKLLAAWAAEGGGRPAAP